MTRKQHFSIGSMVAFVLVTVLICVSAAADEGYLWPVRIDGLWGYMNVDGEIVIPAQYESVELFHDGRAIVSTEDGDGLIDTDGLVLIDPQCGYKIEEYAYAYRIRDYENDGEGFFDKQSGFLLEPVPEYKMIMLWDEDGSGPIAIENQEGLTGYVDRTDGHVVIPFQYTGESNAPGFREGYALVANILIMDESEEWREILPGDTCTDEKMDNALGLGSRYYLIDEHGNASVFPEGIQPISAVYNGIVIISSDLPDASYDDEDDYDRDEDELEEDEWQEDEDEAYYFALHGIAKPDGTIVMEPQELYYLWEPDESGLLCFVANAQGACGMMTAAGEIVIPADYIIPTGGEMPRIVSRNGYMVFEQLNDAADLYTVISIDGSFIGNIDHMMNGRYGSHCDVMENKCLWLYSWAVSSKMVNGARINKKEDQTYMLYTVRNGVLEPVTDTAYESVYAGIKDIPSCSDDFAEGLQAVKKDGLWGYIDADGNTVIQFMYEAAGNFDHGLAIVQKDGLLMYIDQTGAVVWAESK